MSLPDRKEAMEAALAAFRKIETLDHRRRQEALAYLQIMVNASGWTNQYINTPSQPQTHAPEDE